MGRTADSHLVTPPPSALLVAQSSDPLPSLCLGPGHWSNAPSSTLVPETGDPPSMTRPAKGKPSRKTTHSQIEKRRREKINDTMQRLKVLVPACQEADWNLRKLDVLTAAADYIEQLHAILRQTQNDPHPLQSSSASPVLLEADRKSSGQSQMESPATRSVESRGNSMDPCRDSCEEMQVEERSAAESLIQIAESPMLGPITNRISINELMHL